MKRLVYLMIVGGALWASFSAIAPPQAQPAAAAASVVAITPAASASERLADRLGHLGSRIASPLVRSIARDTERLLDEVSPLIPKAQPREAKRARDLSKQIIANDSVALVLLDQGHPVRALRLAISARNLIPSVRQNVAEERAFQ
jgi:hypothetical protein